MLPRLVLLLFVGIAAAREMYNTHDNDYYHSNRGSGHNASRPLAVFCYVNGTRLSRQSQFPAYSSPIFRSMHIKPELCTHLMYGGAIVTNTGEVHDMNDDRSQQSGTGVTMEDIKNLRSIRGDLKKFISVSADRDVWRTVAKNYRDTFVRNVVNFLKTNGFHGINIDWQYAEPEDRQIMVELLRELKMTIRNEGRQVSMVLPSDKTTVERAYEFLITDDRNRDIVDYYMLMANEFNSNLWSTKIAANAPIYSRDSGMNVEDALRSVKKVFDSYNQLYKLILVVPFYGKMYTLEKVLQHGESPIGKPFTNRHDSVIYTYRETCNKINGDQGQRWVRGWDDNAMVPYAYKEKQVIIYDDAQSVMIKTQRALNHKLGGVMAFSIDMDDYEGNCGHQNDFNGGGYSGYSNNNNNGYNNGYNTGRQQQQGSYDYGRQRDYNNRERDYSGRDNYNRGSTYDRDNSYRDNRDYLIHNDYNGNGKYPLLQSMYETVARGAGNSAFQTNPLLGILLSMAVAFMIKS